MHNIKENLLNSLNTYFKGISANGYMHPSVVNKLLFYSIVEEIVNGPYSTLITDKDYRTIIDSLYCIYGSSCIFEFPDRLDMLKQVEQVYYPKYVADEFGELLGTELLGVPVEME